MQETGTPFPEKPQGDPVAISLALLHRHFPQEQQQPQPVTQEQQQAVAKEQQQAGQGAGQGAVQGVEVTMGDTETLADTAAAGTLAAAAAAAAAPALECGGGVGVVLGSGCIIWQQASQRPVS